MSTRLRLSRSSGEGGGGPASTAPSGELASGPHAEVNSSTMNRTKPVCFTADRCAPCRVSRIFPPKGRPPGVDTVWHFVGIVGAPGDLLQPAYVDPQPRTFTREETEALLPEVDRLLAEAQKLAEALANNEQEAQAAEWKPRTNGRVHAEPAVEAPDVGRRSIARQLRLLVERIQALGVVVRDIRSGLIDFPSLREGRIVNLCWRRGEPLEIRFWHELEAGFGGRQPL